MKYLIEELVKRLELQKKKDAQQVNDFKDKDNKTLVLLNAGKIIAFDLCINELKRMLEYYKISSLNLEKKDEHALY